MADAAEADPFARVGIQRRPAPVAKGMSSLDRGNCRGQIGYDIKPVLVASARARQPVDETGVADLGAAEYMDLAGRPQDRRHHGQGGSQAVAGEDLRIRQAREVAGDVVPHLHKRPVEPTVNAAAAREVALDVAQVG